jgi:hypothetical protein
VCLSERIRKSAGSGVHSRSLTPGVDYVIDKKAARLDAIGGSEEDALTAVRRKRAPGTGGESGSLGNLLAAAEHLDGYSSPEGSSSFSGSEGENPGRKKRRVSKESAGRRRGGQVQARMGPSMRGGYRTNQPTFPLKLFDLITSQPLVIGWLNGGTSFRILGMDLFVNVVLPKYFKRKYDITGYYDDQCN